MFLTLAINQTVMQAKTTSINGVKLLTPEIHSDKRGNFSEVYNQKTLAPHIGNVNFIQDNQSTSQKGTLRGFSYQKPPYTQAKLVRVLSGEVLDIALDIRTDSPTYGQIFHTILSSNNRTQLFLPRGIAHAFIALSDAATVLYKLDNSFTPNAELGINHTDPHLNIDIAQLSNIHLTNLLVSGKDSTWPNFTAAKHYTTEEFNQNDNTQPAN